jgi:hypothetical protein
MRVLFELDSEFEEFDGNFFLNLRVKRLIPSVVNFARHFFDVLWKHL